MSTATAEHMRIAAVSFLQQQRGREQWHVVLHALSTAYRPQRAGGCAHLCWKDGGGRVCLCHGYPVSSLAGWPAVSSTLLAVVQQPAAATDGTDELAGCLAARGSLAACIQPASIWRSADHICPVSSSLTLCVCVFVCVLLPCCCCCCRLTVTACVWCTPAPSRP